MFVPIEKLVCDFLFVLIDFLQRVRIVRNADRSNIHGRSVCPSVCLSVYLSDRHVPMFVQTNEDTIVQSSASGRTIILVS